MFQWRANARMDFAQVKDDVNPHNMTCSEALYRLARPILQSILQYYTKSFPFERAHLCDTIFKYIFKIFQCFLTVPERD